MPGKETPPGYDALRKAFAPSCKNPPRISQLVAMATRLSYETGVTLPEPLKPYAHLPRPGALTPAEQQARKALNREREDAEKLLRATEKKYMTAVNRKQVIDETLKDEMDACRLVGEAARSFLYSQLHHWPDFWKENAKDQGDGMSGVLGWARTEECQLCYVCQHKHESRDPSGRVTEEMCSPPNIITQQQGKKHRETKNAEGASAHESAHESARQAAQKAAAQSRKRGREEGQQQGREEGWADFIEVGSPNMSCLDLKTGKCWGEPVYTFLRFCPSGQERMTWTPNSEGCGGPDGGIPRLLYGHFHTDNKWGGITSDDLTELGVTKEETPNGWGETEFAKVLRRAQEKYLLRRNPNTILEMGSQTPRSEWIQQRQRKIAGMTIATALTHTIQDKTGPRAYIQRDISYDIQKGFLKLVSPAASPPPPNGY